MTQQAEKIFCIGFAKTGTTSLDKAFGLLGIPACHHVIKGQLGSDLIEKADREGQKLMAYMDSFAAYSDMGLHEHFVQLDEQYPDAKFIYTYRDFDKWVESKLRHDTKWNARNQDKPPRDVGDQRREMLLETAKLRHQQINDYFQGKDNFLVMDITQGDGWEPLCRFLGIPEPRTPFPFRNKANLGALDRVVWRLKNRVYKMVYGDVQG